MFGPQRSLEAKPPTSTSTGRSIAEKTGPSRGLLLLPLFLFLISYAGNNLPFITSLYLQYHTCTMAQRTLPGLSRAPLRLTLPATLCALSSAIAIHSVLSQRLCLLGLWCHDAL